MDKQRMRAGAYLVGMAWAAVAMPLQAAADDPPLVLEYHSGSVRQAIIVFEGMPFYVSTQVGQDFRAISGTVGTIANDTVEIDFHVMHRQEDYPTEGAYRTALTVNRMAGNSSGGSGSVIGDEDLREVWIRRGLDPLPHLRGALASRSIREFFAGCRYLERVREDAIEFVPLLEDAVTDENPEIQIAAIGRLGHLGRRAASSVPVLERALLDDDPQVRAAAEEALRAIR